MDIRYFIDQAKIMLAKDYSDETIAYYLKQDGADDNKTQELIETARKEYIEERTAKYTVLNKRNYYIWLSLTIFSFILFLFILPFFNFSIDHKFLLSFTGAALCWLCMFYTFSYRKTWNERYVRQIGKPVIYYRFLFAFFWPGVIIYYLISFAFSTVQDHVLKDTQQTVIGEVVSGDKVNIKNLRGEGIEMARLVIKFDTREGKTYIVTKDVSSYEFGEFYKGEKIHMIYSKLNPNNIALLTNDSNIKDFENSAQRDFTVPDLLHLITVKESDMTNELNKISYGWEAKNNSDIWVNEKRQCIIALKQNELQLISSKSDYNYYCTDYLKTNGFKLMNKEDSTDVFHTGEKIFENNKFIVSVQLQVENNGEDSHSVIKVKRKS
jgi:hypothetical protein